MAFIKSSVITLKQGLGVAPDRYQREQSWIVQNMKRMLGIWLQKPWCGITPFWSQTPKAKSVKRPDLRNLLWNISLTNLREFVPQKQAFSDPTEQSKMADLKGTLNLPHKQLNLNIGATRRQRNCYWYLDLF